MRIAINLATRPFVELRAIFARLRLAMLALLLLAIGLGFWLHGLNRRSSAEGARMSALVDQTSGFESLRARNEARMRQPQNMGVLERSQLLNALFAQKSFSWTAVMMDLERVLPNGVQVTSIDPVISRQGEVLIRLRVSGDRDRAVQLVRNLERSQRFIAPRLAGESALTRDKAAALNGGSLQNASSAPGAETVGNGVEFEIFSGYNPLPEAAVDATAGARREGKAASTKHPGTSPAGARAKAGGKDGAAAVGRAGKPGKRPRGTAGKASGGAGRTSGGTAGKAATRTPVGAPVGAPAQQPVPRGGR